MRILNIDPEHYSAEARTALQRLGSLTESTLTREQLLEEIAPYEVLVLRFSHKIDKEVLAAAKSLRFIVTNVTGTDHIDTAAAAERNVQVISLKGEIDFLRTIHATAELTWGLLLSLMRSIPTAAKAASAGDWDRDRFVGRELAGKRLGILGYGRIGQKVARYGQAFSMDVSVYDIDSSKAVSDFRFVSDFRKFLSELDILSIHLPLNSETENMIGPKEIALLPRGALIINTARGRILDEVAMLTALKSEHLGGVALDVLSNEGQDMRGHPVVAFSKTAQNVLLTPHIGGACWEAWAKTELFVVQKLARALAVRQ